MQTGVTVDGMTEITSGLSAGESVVITTPSFGGGRPADRRAADRHLASRAAGQADRSRLTPLSSTSAA